MTPAGGYLNFDLTFDRNQIRPGQILELFFVPADINAISEELRITPILVHPVASNNVTADEWRFIIKLDNDGSGNWIAQRYFARIT